MKHAKRKRDKKGLIVFGVIAVLVIVVAALFSGATSPSENEFSNKEVEENILSSVDSDESEPGLITIETPYCPVSYSSAFSDLIEVKEEEKDDSYALSFFGVLGSDSVLLYEVHFGGSSGTLLGFLDQGLNDIEIRLRVPDLDLRNMDEGEKNSLYAAQETVNDVMASIAENDDFRKSGV